MKPASFAYHLAGSVPEAVALLGELGDEAKILAGGLSLVPMMNFRLARPSALVDVTRIPGLSYLHTDPDGLHQPVGRARPPLGPRAAATSRAASRSRIPIRFTKEQHVHSRSTHI